MRILKTASVFILLFAGCGTSAPQAGAPDRQAADAFEDTQAAADGSSAEDAAGEDSAGLPDDATPTPEDVIDGSSGTQDVVAPNNDAANGDTASDDTDPGPGPIDCSLFSPSCQLGGARVSGAVELSFGVGGDFICSVWGAQQNSLVAWSWEYASGRNAELGAVRGDLGLNLRPVQVGSGTLSATHLGCEFDVLELSNQPPSEGVLVTLSWTGADEGGASFADLDLHVLRSVDACWFDQDDDLHFGSDERLQWGEASLRRSADASGDRTTEWAASDNTPDDANWTVAVDVRSDDGPGGVPAVLSVYTDGELTYELARTVEGGQWWSVGSVAQRGGAPLDRVLGSAPDCVSATCANGEPAESETCNGIDDDCDGEVDESPEACSDHSEPGEAVDCVLFREIDEYRCIER